MVIRRCCGVRIDRGTAGKARDRATRQSRSLAYTDLSNIEQTYLRPHTTPQPTTHTHRHRREANDSGWQYAGVDIPAELPCALERGHAVRVPVPAAAQARQRLHRSLTHRRIRVVNTQGNKTGHATFVLIVVFFFLFFSFPCHLPTYLRTCLPIRTVLHYPTLPARPTPQTLPTVSGSCTRAHRRGGTSAPSGPPASACPTTAAAPPG